LEKNRSLQEYCNIKRRTHTLEAVKKARREGWYKRRKLDDYKFEGEVIFN